MSTKKAYVIGTDVSSSLSPIIFRYWFDKYGVDAEYNFKEIEESSFNKKIKPILEEDNLCGLNITIPFKKKIISYIEKIDHHSSNIGAVNCVTKKNNLLEGVNTDWIGFQKSIEWYEKKQSVIDKNTAIVIGYGGSSKAIIYSLIDCGFKKIKIFNRNFDKIKKIGNKTSLLSFHLRDLPKHTLTADLIINTVPAEVFPNYQLKTKKEVVGFDIVYKPGTKFLQGMNNIAPTQRIYGTTMLVHQAAPCFHKWFDVKPEIDKEIFIILNNAINKRK